MKVKVFILPKKAVVDPQGNVVKKVLEQMGYDHITDVHIGKYLEIDVNGDKDVVVRQFNESCHKFLSNPLIEDYRIEVDD